MPDELQRLKNEIEALTTCQLVDDILYEELERQNKELKQALEFYADDANRIEPAIPKDLFIADGWVVKMDSKWDSDQGKLAKETLRKLEESSLPKESENNTK